MTRRYSQQDLDTILEEFRAGTTLNDLAKKLGRPTYGLATKIIHLSEIDPNTWDPSQVRSYTHYETRKHRGDVKGQKRRWKQRQKGYVVPPPQRVYAHVQINQTKFREYLSYFIGRYPQKKICATVLGVHPSLLSHYLAGRPPSDNFLRRLAEVQQMSYDKLIAYLN